MAGFLALRNQSVSTVDTHSELNSVLLGAGNRGLIG
jgi:hypothetical protein